MTTIKAPLEILSEVTKFDIVDLQKYSLHQNITPSQAIVSIEAYHNQFDCIDKQTAIDFCQSMLKDFCTIEVTAETLNNFLNKK
jgi:D-mannonate dehydratase